MSMLEFGSCSQIPNNYARVIRGLRLVASGLETKARSCSLFASLLPHKRLHMHNRNIVVGAMLLAALGVGASPGHPQNKDAAPFQIIETTIDKIHPPFNSPKLTPP